MSAKRQSSGMNASAETRAAVNRLVRDLGVIDTAARLGVSKHTMDRIRGGLPVQRSTLIAVSLVLGVQS